MSIIEQQLRTATLRDGRRALVIDSVIPDDAPELVREGLARRCDQDTAEADHEARHALVRPMVDALVADMNARGVGDHAQLQANRKARQIEACAWWKANARPWPAEDPNPSARVLNGWPPRQRVNA